MEQGPTSMGVGVRGHYRSAWAAWGHQRREWIQAGYRDLGRVNHKQGFEAAGVDEINHRVSEA